MLKNIFRFIELPIVEGTFGGLSEFIDLWVVTVESVNFFFEFGIFFYFFFKHSEKSALIFSNYCFSKLPEDSGNCS